MRVYGNTLWCYCCDESSYYHSSSNSSNPLKEHVKCHTTLWFTGTTCRSLLTSTAQFPNTAGGDLGRKPWWLCNFAGLEVPEGPPSELHRSSLSWRIRYQTSRQSARDWHQPCFMSPRSDRKVWGLRVELTVSWKHMQSNVISLNSMEFKEIVHREQKLEHPSWTKALVLSCKTEKYFYESQLWLKESQNI